MAEAKTTKKTTTKKAEATKAKVEEKVEEIVKDEEPKVDSRDIKLAEQAAEIEALKAQMAAVLQAQMAAPMVAPAPTKKKKNITIINLCVGGLTLMGTRPVRIDKQFDTVSVSESEATAIIGNMPNATRDGQFYILDADFVEENDLTGAYQGILDDKQFKQLLSQSSDYVVDIFKSASDAQKKIIIDMIIEKKASAQPVDANIVEQIGKLTGIDFSLAEEVEDLDDK